MSDTFSLELQGLDDRTADEAQARGYFGGAVVHRSDGRRYRLVFWEHHRLGQDLSTYAAEGRPYIVDPGLVVVPEVTEDAMRMAVAMMAREGYFDRILPESDDAAR